MHSLLDLKLAETIHRDRLYGVADRPAPARAAVASASRRARVAASLRRGR